MYIRRLLVEHLRNLDSVSIDQFAALNFFIGSNGAGKTSLLEAISIASQGRSFRSHKINTVIHQQHTDLSVFIECTDNSSSSNGTSHKLGIQRDRKSQYVVRIDGATASTLAELSAILPIIVLDSNAFDLLDGASSVRRKFIDWAVFHVEHNFYSKWKAFSQILKQRNALLRSGKDDYALYEPWDIELINLAIDIERYRLNFLAKFQQALNSTISSLDAELLGNKVYYKNGWGLERLEFSVITEECSVSLPEFSRLEEALKAQFPRDLKYQRTHIGPQRADIQLKSGSNDIKDIYSRGQKKTIVAAMKLAQAEVVDVESLKKPILLLDDLPSELDDQHLSRFIQFIIDHSYQSFITAVDDRIYQNNCHENARMFHVERGKITAANA